MEIRWWEQSLADVRPQDDWLSPWEHSHLVTLHIPKRRADWRLGRWTAKHALACEFNLPHDPEGLAGIEIRPAASGAPEVFLGGKPTDLAISISHRGGIAACAVAPGGAMLGCDLEMVEPRSDPFVADYFTAEEQEIVRQTCSADRFALIALLWSAKESALKALGTGLRVDTRSLTVVLDNPDLRVVPNAQPQAPDGLTAMPHFAPLWQSLQVHCIPQHVFHGWWFRCADLIRTAVTLPLTPPPTRCSLSHRESPKQSSGDSTACPIAHSRFTGSPN